MDSQVQIYRHIRKFCKISRKVYFWRDIILKFPEFVLKQSVDKYVKEAFQLSFLYFYGLLT